MKITFNPSFKSKNANIRTADDIQRNAKLSFPFISTSYCDSFYQTNKKWQPNIKAKYNDVMMKQNKKLSAIRLLAKRDAFKGETFDEQNMNAPIFNTLRGVKLLKTANCHECAALSMAAFAANGFYNLERANISANFEFINKETGEVEYKASEPIDHTIVIAKIGKDDVVVDTWLGFADSISSAKAKFKQQLWNSDIRAKAREHRSLFRVKVKEETGKLINPDKDYELKTTINFNKSEECSPENIRMIGYYTRCCFPELVMKPQKIDANI